MSTLKKCKHLKLDQVFDGAWLYRGEKCHKYLTDKEVRLRCSVCGQLYPRHLIHDKCDRKIIQRKLSDLKRRELAAEQKENARLRKAAQTLLDKMDEAGTIDGDESDRVFARYEFDDLRAALSEGKKRK